MCRQQNNITITDPKTVTEEKATAVALTTVSSLTLAVFVPICSIFRKVEKKRYFYSQSDRKGGPCQGRPDHRQM